MLTKNTNAHQIGSQHLKIQQLDLQVATLYDLHYKNGGGICIEWTKIRGMVGHLPWEHPQSVEPGIRLASPTAMEKFRG